MKRNQPLQSPFVQWITGWLLLVVCTLQAQTTTVNFTTSGTPTTWTCPPGVTSIQVEAWGGGGGGCGTPSSTSRSAGGGAGGNYVKNTAISVTPGTTYTITVGAGGAGGVGNPSTNPPTAGGSTSITRDSDSTLLVRAGGGAPGGASTSTSGGPGGVGATTNNFGWSSTFNYKGGDGGTGINGTGGAAGTAAAGGGAAGSSGNGNGITAGTGGSNGAAAITTSGSGNNGNAPGGGGGGGMSAAASAKNGGNGGAGKLTITYITPTPPSLTTSLTALSINQALNSSLNAQTFTVAGTLLTSAVSITTIANSALELSTNNSSYGASLSLNAAGDGTLNNTTIYVRLKSTATVGSGTENITISATNATSKTVAVSYLVYRNFYMISSGDPNVLSNWWTNIDGTGSNPTNFSTDNQYFNLLSNATTSGNGWAVSGTNAKVIVGASNQGAVVFTIANGAPMTGTLDVNAAQGGASNKIIIQHDIQHSTSQSIFTNPTWGNLDANTILEFSGTTNAILGGGTNLFNKTIKSIRVVNNGIARINGVGSNIPTINNEVYVEAGSALYCGQNSLSYINILNGGSLTLNGTLGTDKTTGWFSNDAAPSSTSGAINFVGTVNLTMGVNSTIDFTRIGSSTAQTIPARSDYQNMNISGNDAAKTFAGITTIAGKLNVSYYTTTSTRAISANNAITASELVFNGTAAQNVSPTLMPFLSFVNAPITFKNNAGVVMAADNSFPDGLAYKLAGGILSSGATSGYSDTFGTLNLTENSSISLATGAHSLQFANSAAIGWTSGKTLTINGWSGSLGQSGTEGKLFIGTTAGGLTATQLSQIVFSSYPTASAIQLSSGEIVPQCSNPTSGGSISGNQTICAGQIPVAISHVSAPSGQIGTASIEYQWQMSTDNSTFTDINGANSSSYSPASLSTTGYFRRLARIGCLATWTGAAVSNTITVTVNQTLAPNTQATQSLCYGSTISNLTANGSNIQWYTTASGGSALSNVSALSSGNYYATQTLNGCESSRTVVAVTINSTAAPSATNQTYCTGATVAQLIANGTGIQWYAAANGGSALTNNTLLTNNTYYASQTLNGCESSRQSVVVSIQNTTAPSAQAQWLPQGSTVAQLTATGDNIKWYSNNNGATALSNVLQLQSGTYYATQTLNGCESAPTSVSVTLYNTNINTSNLVASQCGVMMSNIWNVLYATVVSNANLYRFEVTQGSNTIYVDKTSNSLQLPTIPGGIQYNMSYTIRIAVKVGENWSNFGNSCVVITPNSPTPTTLYSTYCGNVLSNIEDSIYCPQVLGATGYRFEIRQGNYTEMIDRNTNSFTLTQLNTPPSYNTTYSVRVAVSYNGAYGSYGNSCSVTTPSAPTPPAFYGNLCGSTLSNLSTSLYCNQPYGVQSYRFEINDGAQTYIVDRPVNNFNLMLIPGGANYNTTYSIRIAGKYNGLYSPYGTACSVTTPAASSNLPVMANCGVQATNKWTTFYCNQIHRATQYRFELSHGGQTKVYTSAQNVFQFANFNGIVPNTAYTVRAAVYINGSWQPYGSSCTITSPVSMARHTETTEEKDVMDPWKVSVYPNPSAHEFQFEVYGNNGTAVVIKAFDMTGKELDQWELSSEAIQNVGIGSQWAAGVYLLHIQQGEQQQIIRVIKQ